MKSSIGPKEKVKKIIGKMTATIDRAEHCFAENIVCEYPDEMGKIENSLFNGSMDFLIWRKEYLQREIFEYGVVETAKSFFESADVQITERESHYDGSVGIYACKILKDDTNVFIVDYSKVDMEILYGDDKELFDYYLGNWGDCLDEIESKSVLPNEAIFGYYFSANNWNKNRKNIIILVNDCFFYTGKDFSKMGKEFLARLTEKSVSNIGGSCFSNTDFFPFDYYFKTLRPGLPVDYFINRMATILEKKSITINNVGCIFERFKDELIARFAFASNNYVGTLYSSVNISVMKKRYAQFPKPVIINKPFYEDAQLRSVFILLSKSASLNLCLLRDSSVLKPLFTAEWLYKNIGSIIDFDNTFICFGYFKAVETLLTNILLDQYVGCEMDFNSSMKIVISQEKVKWFNVGNMMNFLLLHNKLENCNQGEIALMRKTFKLWRTQIRNGYFHKDLISENDVTHIRNITFEVIFMILGMI